MGIQLGVAPPYPIIAHFIPQCLFLQGLGGVGVWGVWAVWDLGFWRTKHAMSRLTLKVVVALLCHTLKGLNSPPV